VTKFLYGRYIYDQTLALNLERKWSRF